MFQDTIIDDATIRAYRETEYRVSSLPPIVLHIGLRSQPLAELYKQKAASCSAFLTACNPFSRQLSESQNRARHAELQSFLQERGFSFIEGIGKHPGNGWPQEQSLLVLAIPREDAQDLGRRLEQNALVWCGTDATPQLDLLR